MQYLEHPTANASWARFDAGSYSDLLSLQPPLNDVGLLPLSDPRYSVAWSQFRRLFAASEPSARTEGTVAATLQDLRRDLADAAEEAATPGWDGYSAKAVTRDTVARAEVFLAGLKSTWPRPNISIDPDGDVWFQWQREPSRTFAVAIDASGVAHYAGLFGKSRFHGAEMVNEQLRGVVQTSLDRLFLEAAAR